MAISRSDVDVGICTITIFFCFLNVKPHVYGSSNTLFDWSFNLFILAFTVSFKLIRYLYNKIIIILFVGFFNFIRYLGRDNLFFRRLLLWNMDHDRV